MNLDFLFFFNSILLGVGLAADAFTVSLADGLTEPCMCKKKSVKIAGAFGIFQGLMPLIGWVCVHTIVEVFSGFSVLIPWIALGLLSFIGGKMIYEGVKEGEEECTGTELTTKAIILQGVATSIDALSVGFTIANHSFIEALISVIIIGLITFGLCLGGLYIGKKFGNKIASKATIFGGAILVFIGIEIFISSIIS
jgi:putative Mn2+ efflux pump MntP